MAVFGVTAVAAVLNAVPSVAEGLTFVNEFFIRILGSVFSALPFSFLGILTVCALPVLILVIGLFVLSKNKARYLIKTAAVLCILLTVFCLVMGFNYSKESVYDTLGLETGSDDKELLTEAAEYFLAETNKAAELVEFVDGHSVMPHTFDEMAGILLESYRESEYFGFLYGFDLRVKAYEPAFVMNLSGIAGIFFPFFAEINVCANLPDSDLPVTAAHEIAHSKGIMNEGECNFIAYIICISSGDAFVRYAGYSAVLARLLSQIKKTDGDAYQSFLDRLDPNVLQDYRWAGMFYRSFDGPVQKISDWLNDIYLKINKIGAGTASYAQDVKGILAFFRQNIRDLP